MAFENWSTQIGKTVILAAAVAGIWMASLPQAFASDGGEVLGRLTVGGSSLSMDGYHYQETLMADLVADAVREAAGTEIAMVNAGDLTGKSLRVGDVTWEHIHNVIREDQTLAVVDITAPQLAELLEAAVSAVTVDVPTETIDREMSASAAFVSVSGISFIYNAGARSGERIMTVYDETGREIDLSDTDRTFSLAASEHMLSGGYGLPEMGIDTPLDVTLTEAVADYFRVNGEIAQCRTGRITAAGTVEGPIISQVPMLAIVGVIVVITAFRLFATRRKDEFGPVDVRG